MILESTSSVLTPQQAADANPVWYHTIDLSPEVATPGAIDLRGVVGKVFATVDLKGKTAVDVGTFDGFWAFEMERRGATVKAVDLDLIDGAEWPPLNRARLNKKVEEEDIELGRGFRLAHAALDSSVERVISNVYDLTPEAVGGEVDVIFMGAIQQHLRDQVKGLEAALHTLKPGGTLVGYEPISIRETLLAPRRPVAYLQTLTTDFNWWTPNLSALLTLLVTAGFVDVKRTVISRPKSVHAMNIWHAGFTAKRPV